MTVRVTFDRTELRILWLVSQGHTNQAIANQVQLSVDTVKARLHRANRILEARNRAHLVTRAIEEGVMGLDPEGALQLRKVPSVVTG